MGGLYGDATRATSTSTQFLVTLPDSFFFYHMTLYAYTFDISSDL